MFSFEPITREEAEKLMRQIFGFTNLGGFGVDDFAEAFNEGQVAACDFAEPEPETGCCGNGCCMDDVANGVAPVEVTAPTTLNFEMVQNGFVITVTDSDGVRRYIEDCECQLVECLEAWVASHG